MIIRNISSKIIGIGGLGDLMPDAYIKADEKWGKNSAINRLVEMKMLSVEKEKKEAPVVEEVPAVEEAPKEVLEDAKKDSPKPRGKRKAKVVEEAEAEEKAEE